MLPWLVAGGVVIATASGRNIAITLLPDLIAPPARRPLALAIQVIVLITSICVLWSSQPILNAAKFQTLATLGTKQIWGYSSLAYAFGAMSVLSALEIVRLLARGDLDASATRFS